RSQGEKPMRSFSISDFKAHALGILNGIVETQESVLVTKRGKPIARVSPCSEEATSIQPGRLKDTLTFVGDLVSPVLPVAPEHIEKGNRS
ncbi:MAG TPA: type II toxin-antitoxin system prevent-host-death family antitoxin, partial [Candidatus Sumerlaeota bacterium]|nr:type II toxin-antitoxin system prevent-host-death family antitoxin [Candidatus Sumerlaeota bacterium]